MSMTLYHGEPNGPSFTVLAALFEKNLDATLVPIDLSLGARHMLECAGQTEVAMSIEGEGPVLVVNGEGMTDSVFIACYLDNIGSGPALRPADPYARWEVMMWCRQIIERVAPAAALLGCQAYPVKPNPANLANITSADLLERWNAAASGQFDDEQLADSREKIVQIADKIEARLNGRDWLMGEFSIADLESYAWLAGMLVLLPSAFDGKNRTAKWMERLRNRPAVSRALALAKAQQPENCWAIGPEINRWG